ncbi:MAG: YopX family protein [Lachnospiraceae bacterium]|nr:YopX family protein [Lachnospiraceae bacterium]
MRYRGLTEKGEMVYGMPSYGFQSEEVAEIGTPDGDFQEIMPGTLGEYTGYTDRKGNGIYTGDITRLVLPGGEARLFEVAKMILDREMVPPKGFTAAGRNMVRLNTYAFIWLENGAVLLPCVDQKGRCDTGKMEIIGNVHQNPGLLVRGGGGS